MKKLAIPFGVLVAIIIGVFVAFSVGNRDSEEVFSLVSGERPVWDISGIYEGNKELEARAQNEIEKLNSLRDSAEFSEYDIEIGIAQQYELLGNGERAYQHLLAAIEINPARSLAYSNLGVLLGKAGARESAKVSFEMALDRDDNVTNRINYIQHLEQYFGNNLSLIESAHVSAIEKFPRSKVLQERYEGWKKLHDR